MMKKIVSIEKVSNGFIVTNGNLKRVYDSSPLEFELDQIHQMLYNSKDGDSHTIVIEVDPPVFTSQDNDSIELCGLLWDKENISVGGAEKDGHHYFTWTEAMEAAQKQGKRLPTADEWKALCDLGSTWDEELRGLNIIKILYTFSRHKFRKIQTVKRAYRSFFQLLHLLPLVVDYLAGQLFAFLGFLQLCAVAGNFLFCVLLGKLDDLGK